MTDKFDGFVKRIRKISINGIIGLIIGIFFFAFASLGLYASEIRNPLQNRGYSWDENTWTYVYFGAFPQTEVTDASVIASIEAELSAKNITEGDVRIDGVKYRKVNKIRKQYVVENRTAYKYVYENHYYRWERIKWRVLNVSDNKVLLMSDKALTSCIYSVSSNNRLMWSNSRLRSYLNGYGALTNLDGADYSLKGDNFYTLAFSKYESEKMLDMTVANKSYTTSDNVKFTVGRDETVTKDKVYALSYEDIVKDSYGFGKGTSMGLHENRKVMLSDYVRMDEEACISSANNAARYWLMTNNSQGNAYYIKDGRIYSNSSAGTYAVVPVILVDMNNNSLLEITDPQAEDDGKLVIDSNKSTISYVLNGGINSALNPTSYFEGTPVTKLYPASRTGYIFKGWYWDSALTNSAPAILTTTRGNVTLYAKWEAEPKPAEPDPPKPPVEPEPKKGMEIKSNGATYAFIADSKNKITGVELKKYPVKTSKIDLPDKITYKNVSYKVTKIGNNTFKNKKSLKSVSIGKYVTEIGKNAFYGCTKLKTLELNDRLVKIGDYAFYNNKALETIVIPKNVSYIGKSAFQNCKELLKITIKTTKLTKEETIGKNAFKRIYPNAVAIVPAKRLSKYREILALRGINGAKQSIRKK